MFNVYTSPVVMILLLFFDNVCVRKVRNQSIEVICTTKLCQLFYHTVYASHKVEAAKKEEERITTATQHSQ